MVVNMAMVHLCSNLRILQVRPNIEDWVGVIGKIDALRKTLDEIVEEYKLSVDD